LWPLRAVLWAALLVVAYRGITAIVFGEKSSSASGAAAPVQPAAQFPATLAEAYAMQFGLVYLNANPATQAQRAQALAALVPSSVTSTSPDLGWNGTGQLRLQSEQLAGIDVSDVRHAVVSLLVSVNGQLMDLGVPVYASGSEVVVSGPPSWLPAPQQGAPPPATQAVTADQVAQGQLADELPAFFQAYASGDPGMLSRFAAPGTSLTGLGGAVGFDSIASLIVPQGGPVRQVSATVVWQVVGPDGPTGAKFSVPYRVSVVEVQSGKWYVSGIGASTEAVGAR
jgi:Conjugative transposon protein TcpC